DDLGVVLDLDVVEQNALVAVQFVVDERAPGTVGVGDGLLAADAPAEANQDDARPVLRVRQARVVRPGEDRPQRRAGPRVRAGGGRALLGADRQAGGQGPQPGAGLQEASAVDWGGHGPTLKGWWVGS